MPGSQIFDMNTTGDPQQESPTITAISGEFARVRFEERKGDVGVRLKIVGNGITTYEPIYDSVSWVSGALMGGDVVSLVSDMNGSAFSQVKGVLEIGT